MKNKLRRLGVQLHNNRGVGLVTVLIVVAFLIVLGSIALFTSYNGLRSRISAREGEERFYDAETAMNRIQQGLETSAASAFTDVYKTMLENYGALTTDQLAAKQNEVTASFKSKLGIDNGSTVQKMKEFIDMNGIEVSVSAITQGTNSNKQVTFTFTGVKTVSTVGGRKSTVSADFVVTLPNVQYYLSQYRVSGISEYSLISKDTLKLSANSNTLLTGNVYVKSIETNAAKLTVKDGLLVSAGDITVSLNGTFVSDTDSEIFANGILLQPSSKLELSGTTNIYNDLNFMGAGASAALKGTYFGFGNSTKIAGQSSAILFNNTGAELDLTELKKLVLAGYSFIDGETEMENYEQVKSTLTELGALSAVRTGESMSARSSQSVYLIPAEHIRYTDEGGALASVASNPIVVNSESIMLRMLTAEIRTTDEFLLGATIKPVAVKEGDQWVVMFFAEFTDPQQASVYFKKYFQSNQTNLEQYLTSYAKVATLTTGNTRSSSVLQTEGYTFYNATKTGDTLAASALTLNAYLSNADELSAECKSKQTQYQNLCKTLTDYGSSDSSADNPYSYLLKDYEIENKDFYLESGALVAKFVDDDYTYDGTNKDLCLIVASGNVTVESDFKGLILAGGTVTAKSDSGKSITIQADPGKVVKASTALENTKTDAKSVSYYIESLKFGTSDGENETGSDNSASLVTMTNWKTE